MNCKICGTPINPEQWINGDILVERQLCQSCNHWQDIVNEKESHQIIDGTSFYVDPNENSKIKGFGGRKHTLQNLTTGEIITTTNLWCQGDIPKYWKQFLPDTHKFVE